MNRITFIDTEVSPDTGKMVDFGAIKEGGEMLHESSLQAFTAFICDAEYVCGHNIVQHDLNYLRNSLIPDEICRLPERDKVIDTLYWSALLYPQRPYHRLVKDDKLQTDEMNNPLNDAMKARDLFYDESETFQSLPELLKRIYFGLLEPVEGYSGFFRYHGFHASDVDVVTEIKECFDGKFCVNADLKHMAEQSPVALAYCLAILQGSGEVSLTPRWVLHWYPEVDALLHQLREKPCRENCVYCRQRLDAVNGLKQFFGYDAYRTFDGVALQEQAVTAAIQNRSLLAVFPTGGGKSITFQVPALLAGQNTRGLTVIISPLQSLMKDQVDNLEEIHITDSVAINGLLDPIERAEAFRRVEEGEVSLLYISPESLRSKTIERLLLGRRIVRFVIDEAHCFSAWGQDFRVDYLYIAEFIRNLCRKKQIKEMIPVSCFTATAKQNVIEDIQAYFKDNLGLDLDLFTAGASRKNLTYKVLEKAETEKYDTIRSLLEYKKCPTIIYVSRTGTAAVLAQRLSQDGYPARAYHGKMEKKEKSENQDLFIRGEIDIMVATSAFGMGVDKKDVGMVIHHDISDSLENYVQEAGRAGRDQRIEAECFILFNDDDLNKHFMLLNQTRISIQEIQQVWRAIKDATKRRAEVSGSALELARAAGWDDTVRDIETRVTTAIAALENAGYIKRGQNMPRVYADSILAHNVAEAADKIRTSELFNEKDKEHAVRIITKLISSRSRKGASGDTAESRVDYIADDLGIEKRQVLQSIQKLREIGVLADAKDLTAYVDTGNTLNRQKGILRGFMTLERFLIDEIPEEKTVLNLKELNERAAKAEVSAADIGSIRSILNYWSIKKFVRREVSKHSRHYIRVELRAAKKEIVSKMDTRFDVAEYILQYLDERRGRDETTLSFSVLELKENYNFAKQLLSRTTTQAVEEALFYLSRIGALKLEGGFLVTYNALSIERLQQDNKIRYKQEDYKNLKQYYEQKTQMIHIVGAYAAKMLADYQAALEFADDYFQLDYHHFLQKYFSGNQREEIRRNLTPDKFCQLFGELSPTQLKIINDRESKYIVVAAGPGSGKTRILVHKLASLLLMEEVRHEQLLMITFSRAAATEFKRRLLALIGNAAHFVQIQTFHSFCFDLLGKVGDLEKSSDVIKEAVGYIGQGKAEPSKITKTVVVIDEAQDMDQNEFQLIQALIDHNDDIRVIAVGDDDQNIFEFRNSDSRYMQELLQRDGSVCYELVENYRSKANLVAYANLFAELLQNRMKKTPNIAVQKENGRIRMIRYQGGEVMTPAILQFEQEQMTGSVCIMAKTNEEALQIAWLLHNKGLPARLIQSNEHYDLCKLREIRYFIQCLKLTSETVIIQAAVWENALSRLKSRFARSKDLAVCLELLNEFRELNSKYMYVSDFTFFLAESKEEDFCKEEYGQIYVSTIHKSKGREFDHVILLLKDYAIRTGEQKRTLYVAMTRAREQLMIHYNADFPGQSGDARYQEIESLQMSEDCGTYEGCNRILLQAGYRDVQLSNFRLTQRYLDGLISGDELLVDKTGCWDMKENRILFFSDKFKSELQEKTDRGYQLERARIKHMLWWKGESETKELLIVLPEVEMVWQGDGVYFVE